MDWFSTDPSRPGVFAVGQEAYGIFALGQLATGVIAIGQIARGVIAIGQGAVGVVAIGQGALGIVYAAGMLGVAGRGHGGVLRLFPKITIQRFEPPPLPPLSTLADLERGDRDHGWILARLEKTDRGPVLEVDGKRLALATRPELDDALTKAGLTEDTHACVEIAAEQQHREPDGGYREMAPSERVLVALRLTSWKQSPPRAHMEGPMIGPLGLIARAIGLFAVVVGYWALAGDAIVEMFQASGK